MIPVTPIPAEMPRVAAIDDVEDQVRAILADVQQGGAEAVRSLDARFGEPADKLVLGPCDIEAAATSCPPGVRAALQAAATRIEAFHARQKPVADAFEPMPGLRLGRRPVPLERVACYAPGGRAVYPSTVLMAAIPARVAGVKEVCLVTPPRDGRLDPLVAAAARVAGIEQVLLSGGAQGVGAVVFGVDGFAPVQAVVGPGNAYVTQAKRLLSGMVRTDSPAGPSELLVIADETATAGPIAWDMLAQAEHDPDAQVILVTTSRALAEDVAKELDRLVPDEPRRAIIEKSLKDHGRIFLAADRDEMNAFARRYAAEHLEIHTADPEADLELIGVAGSVFLGPHTPVSLGDYGSGTNHILPTMGLAALRGGLCVDDFITWVTWQQADEGALAALAGDTVTIAEAEGLAAHAAAVKRRMA